MMKTITTLIFNEAMRGRKGEGEKKQLLSSFPSRKKGERGGALVALLALMTLIAIFMMAAAPSVLMEVQREKELEAIRRGEEIAEAIRLYVQYSPGNQAPKSMDDLLEGVSLPGRTKKLMILRASAAIDPLSSDGKWKTVQATDTELLAQFQRKVMDYNGGLTPNSPNFRPFQEALVKMVSFNLETTEDTDPPGGEDSSDNVEGPFIGVVSRSQRKSVLTYYGIERHDRWVFTPLYRLPGSSTNLQRGRPFGNRNEEAGREDRNRE